MQILRMTLVGLCCPLLGLSCTQTAATEPDSAEEQVLEAIRQDVPFAKVSAEVFEQLGWDLPDGGSHVKQLADAAPGGAFDPRALETLPSEEVGYQASWHVVRYSHYGLEWDITGLYLQPHQPLPGLPTLVQIHGGSGNWYQFFLTPLNKPGFGQYLAQKIPVLLVTIPGNYRPGGWTLPPGERKPAYVLDRELGEDQIRARNAIFTFSLISEGVVQLIETATTGPVLISGHSTGGEIQFLLKDRLKSRLRDLSMGWGTGGPAVLRREWADHSAAQHNRTAVRSTYRPITEVRGRVPEGYVHGYVGPFNPFLETQSHNIYDWYFRVISEPELMLKVAKQFFNKEGRRKPFFKQHIQDLEHTGRTEHREEMEQTIRDILKKTQLAVDPEQVIADLFATTKTKLEGYRKMIWTTSTLDEGHWDPDPSKARELFVANQYRKRNPEAAIRVLVYDTLMTHVGYLERPRQLAGGTLAAVKWLYEDQP